MKQMPSHQPGSELLFDLAGVNNQKGKVPGQIHLKLLDSKGKVTVEKKMEVSLDPLSRSDFIASLDLPQMPGGYLLIAAYTPTGSSHEVISRRYIRIGKLSEYSYFEMQPVALED